MPSFRELFREIPASDPESESASQDVQTGVLGDDEVAVPAAGDSAENTDVPCELSEPTADVVNIDPAAAAWGKFVETISSNYNVTIEPSAPLKCRETPLYALPVIDSVSPDGNVVCGWIASSEAIADNTCIYLGAHGKTLAMCISGTDRTDVQSHFEHKHIVSFRFVLGSDKALANPEHPANNLNDTDSAPLFISFSGETLEGICANNSNKIDFIGKFEKLYQLEVLKYGPIENPSDLHKSRIDVIEKDIDVAHYSAVSGMVFPDAKEAAQHYYVWGELSGLTPTSWFNPTSYQSSYIGRHYISSLFYDYLINGRMQGIRNTAHALSWEYDQESIRQATSALFDCTYYRSQIKTKKTLNDSELLKHYLENSIKNSTDPCDGFSTSYYNDHNRDISLTGLHPFAHYAILGQYEFRRPHPRWCAHDLKFNHDPRKLRKTLTLPAQAECANENKPHPILGIHVHAYFVEEFELIMEYLDSVSPIHTLYVTTNSEDKRSRLLAMLQQWDNGDCIVEVVVVENRGRDVLPMINWMQETSVDFDLVLHVHTKRSPHLGDYGRIWFRHNLDRLIGTKDAAQSLFNYFNTMDNVGIAYPAPVGLSGEWLRWGSNLPLAQYLMRKLDVDDSIFHTELDFPAGTMFWFRPDALKSLFNHKITGEDFPEEPIGLDGTIAHTIERCIPYLATSAGYESVKTTTLPFSMVPSHPPAQPTVSAIMSIYNAEAHLNAAIDSVINQGNIFPSLELILVDNNSSDRSRLIAEHYSQSYANIKLVDEPINGTGNALNRGMESATGQFVLFLDANDLLPANGIEKLYSIACTTDAEIVYSAHRSFNRDLFGDVLPLRPECLDPHEVGLLDIKQYCATSNNYVIEPHEKTILNTVLEDFSQCAKLYSRDFLIRNALKFAESTMYEQSLFAYDGYLKCEKLAFTDDVTYLRRDKGNRFDEADDEYVTNTWAVTEQLLRQTDSLSNEYLKQVLRQALVAHIQGISELAGDRFDVRSLQKQPLSLAS